MPTDLESYTDGFRPVWHVSLHSKDTEGSLETLSTYIDEFIKFEEKHWRDCSLSCNTIRRCGDFNLLSDILKRIPCSTSSIEVENDKSSQEREAR